MGGTLRAGIACSSRCSCHASSLMRFFSRPSGAHTSDYVPFAGVMSPGNIGGHSAGRYRLFNKVLMPCLGPDASFLGLFGTHRLDGVLIASVMSLVSLGGHSADWHCLVHFQLCLWLDFYSCGRVPLISWVDTCSSTTAAPSVLASTSPSSCAYLVTILGRLSLLLVDMVLSGYLLVTIPLS